VSQLQGLNTAGSFSPDGTKIALTVSRSHYPNLYLINRTGKILRKLTAIDCIDTSPCFGPNGQEIVFISDRPGYPQLFIVNLEGGNVRRLTTDGYCDSPAWSPRGDKIAFTMRQGRDNYDLYLYDLATSRITRLTQGDRNNENPSWSPDGRFIVFSSTRSGKSELYITAVDGSGVRKLGDIPGSSYTPSWSP
jgi:TolB protein